jgi:N-hydroxyarylamine O-acetyltransferase
MNTEKYLERINFSGDIDVSPKTLSQLQYSHLLSVPFENLDIHRNLQIDLNIEKIYNKVVLNNRGGFCYELNGLFYELLVSLGFNAKRISAKVYNDAEDCYGEEFDHLAIIVTISNKHFLVDVGFGDFVSYPLRLILDTKQNDPSGVFFIDKYNNEYYRVNKVDGENISPQYIFTTQPRELSEFKPMCNYHQTNPKSYFTRNKVISLLIETGRITLTNNNLKLTERGISNILKIDNDDDFIKELWKHFRIKM